MWVEVNLNPHPFKSEKGAAPKGRRVVENLLRGKKKPRLHIREGAAY